MKVQPTPTSPKVRKMKDIENLYNDKGLREIHKPARRNGKVFTIVLAIIIGIFSGFFGGLFFYYFFDDSNSVNEDLPIQISRQSQIQPEKLEDLSEKYQQTLVGIYQEKTDVSSTNPIAGLYYPWEQLTTGLIVTSDGWIVVPKWSMTDLSQDYLAVTSDGDTHPIEKIMADPALPVYYLKIEDANLSVIKFANLDDTTVGEEIFVMHRNAELKMVVLSSFLAQKNYLEKTKTADYIESSDVYSLKYLIKDSLAQDTQGAIAVNTKGEIIGLVCSDGWPTNQIIPANQIDTGLTSLLKNSEIVRPKLGIHYIDLSQTVNMSILFSQGKESGALIHGDREINRPAIISNSIAETAGLLKGDIIKKVDNVSLDRNTPFSDLLLAYDSGEEISLEVLREGKTITVELKLDINK
ncbi:S1C family serine protease [Patescibacteria group bacterium]|nr:S1C family serine protease [Patescibacteria group bacterium]MBU1890848.1 S1C family serine protease [Patescibacteria group bacterium]